MNEVRVAVLAELAKLGDEEVLSAIELSVRLGIPIGSVNHFLQAARFNDEVFAVTGGFRLTKRMTEIMGPLPPEIRSASAQSFNKIQTALQSLDPAFPQPLKELFARTLAGVTDGVLTSSEAAARLTVEENFLPLLERMLGKEILAEKAVIRVESGSSVERLTIDKAAGRDIVNVTLQVHFPERFQAASRDRLTMQRSTSTVGSNKPFVATAPCIDETLYLDTNEARHYGETNAMPQFDGGRAFIIGVADYTDPNLRIASGITVKEAQKVESLLKKQTVCAYPEAGVKLVTNPDREYLLREFKAFVEKVAGDSTASTVILFYAGHGVEGTDKKYYFTTRDTKLTTELKAVPDTAVGSDELMVEIRKIGTKKMLFVVNACFSGNVMPSLSPGEKLPGLPPPKSLGVEFLATGEGRALISACRPDQRSYFSNSSELSYFGSGLADGLEGNGINPGSGYIGLFELYLHVYDQVTATVVKLGAKQDPMIRA